MLPSGKQSELVLSQKLPAKQKKTYFLNFKFKIEGNCITIDTYLTINALSWLLVEILSTASWGLEPQSSQAVVGLTNVDLFSNFRTIHHSRVKLTKFLCVQLVQIAGEVWQMLQLDEPPDHWSSDWFETILIALTVWN